MKCYERLGLAVNLRFTIYDLRAREGVRFYGKQLVQRCKIAKCSVASPEDAWFRWTRVREYGGERQLCSTDSESRAGAGVTAERGAPAEFGDCEACDTHRQ